jgi:transposase-like protein
MGRKPILSPEEKLVAIQEYKNGNGGLASISSKYGVCRSSLKRWILSYDHYGEDGLITTSKNLSYSASLKDQAIQDYLSGGSSLDLICVKYEIKSNSTLLKWIKNYNNHIENKDYKSYKGDVYMKDNKSFTIDKKMEIVDYCIKHGKDYVGAASKFSTSYSNVYSWTKKYLMSGKDGLIDNRGRKIPIDELTELEKAYKKIEFLERQLKYKEDAELVRKKYREIERRVLHSNQNTK